MQWKRIRYRLEWAGVKALAFVIPLLSRKGCAALARLTGRIAFAVDKTGRAVTLSNIRAALGAEYSEAEQLRIGRESYQSFARTMLDLFWAPRLAQPGWEKYIEIIGAENLRVEGCDRYCVLCAHEAGVEWASLACGIINLRGALLSEAFKNPRLDEIFTRLRSTTGQEVWTRQMSMLRMLKRLQRGGGIVGMLIDLTIPPSQAALVLDTFGLQMCNTALHAILHQRTGALMVPLYAQPRADGSYRVIIEPALDIPEGATTQQIAQIVWDKLEKRIRANPGRWMWNYKHWRFRPKGEEGARYPYYARESGRFEKLRAATVKSQP
jgi:Kdo2-lipid IVA lauroyltransferase/acyltransferase